jgi:glycerate 2-kinase
MIDAMGPALELLEQLYLEAIDRCDPARLVEQHAARWPSGEQFDLVAIGKAAASMSEGAFAATTIHRGMIVVPEGYAAGHPRTGISLCRGTHPDLSPASFAAGRQLLEFVRSAGRAILFLISGGSSATVEWPLAPVAADDLAALNQLMVRSSLRIEQINVVRKHLSAIKGGRLAEISPPGSRALILSDVAPGQPEMVGSGPTWADSSTCEQAAAVLDSRNEPIARQTAALLRSGALAETPKVTRNVTNQLLADNRTLLSVAAGLLEERSIEVTLLEESLEQEVAQVAERLVALVSALPPGHVLVAGGEPVVEVRGSGRGGRCSELAVLLAQKLRAGRIRVDAILGSSDGLDGNSGAAGVAIAAGQYFALDDLDIAASRAVADSDTIALAGEIGHRLELPVKGNNLRDLYLLARR